MAYNKLSSQEEAIILGKDTEVPFSGEYDDYYEDGTYICRRCNTPLFSSQAKFNSGCGWPSFEENYPHAIKRVPDPDEARTEIQCSNCQGHLGHVFEGERLTENNTRHCVNSLSIRFIPKDEKMPEVLPNLKR